MTAAASGDFCRCAVCLPLAVCRRLEFLLSFYFDLFFLTAFYVSPHTMDRVLYTAMTGAKHVFMQQAGTANNLANANTIGFKAMEHRFRAVEVQPSQSAFRSRAFVVDASVADVFDEGPLMFTGNGLDIAVEGRGWIAVRDANGVEAYTRAGSLFIDDTGVLRNKAGQAVIGDGGDDIIIPPESAVEIAADGTISTVPTTGNLNQANVIGRVKLVNPPENLMRRGEDGLFRGGTGELDENVKVASGVLEGSNVNVTDAMVNLISLSRQFELQIKVMQTADADAQQANKLLSLS